MAATLGLVVYLHRSGPPAAVRLLPEADAIVYVNLGRIRLLAPTQRLAEVIHEPAYAGFIKETGIQFERDLEEAALAVHLPKATGSSALGDAPAAEPLFSSVFVARFNSERLIAYLKKHTQGQAVERYRDLDIFHIPVEGHISRVAILSVDTVAVSTFPSEEPMHYMIDRYKEGASPSSKRTLVRDYYRQVPLGSLVWAIGRYVPGQNRLPGEGPPLGTPVAATWVASARYTGSLHVRCEAFTAGEPDAKKLHDQAAALLGMYRSFQSEAAKPSSDPDVKALLESIEVAQQRDRVVFTATVPVGFIEKALAEPPQPASSPEKAP
ncbi:MAG: hypothetical protein ACRD2Y_16180 [Terriglobales bacterium]